MRGSLAEKTQTLQVNLMQRGEVRDPVKTLIFGLLSCGIYQLYWLIQIAQELNAALGRDEFTMKDVILSFVTCGIWGIFVMWRLSNAVVELQQKWGVQPVMDAPILFLMNLLYLGPFFIQQSLNNAWENGTPGGAGGYSAPGGF